MTRLEILGNIFLLFVFSQLESKEGSVLRSIQDFLTSIAGFAPVVFLGRGIFQYSFGIVPHR